MANIKSQIKRNRQNEKRRTHNRLYRGRARTMVQKARLTIQQEESSSEKKGRDTVNQAVKNAISELDKAAQKGVIHKNNAARRKSRLMRQLAKSE